MSQLRIKKILGASVLALTLSNFAYAATGQGTDVQNLIAGYGSNTRSLLTAAPTDYPLGISTDIIQATYLISPNSPLVGPLTQQLLKQTVNAGFDNANDYLSFSWQPNSKPNADLEKEPLKSIDMDSLLQPMTYTNTTQQIQAKNFIEALGGTLAPFNPVDFNQLIANLSGDKDQNLKAKLQDKQVQSYLAALRSYVATQTVALNNLYQLYSERQPLDRSKLPVNLKQALNTIAKNTKAPISPLQLENYMATRRILDKSWAEDLLKDTPASLQREQAQISAEILAELYQNRMTSERLLATMSVLVLELNSQIRTQLQNQVQSISNPQSNG